MGGGGGSLLGAAPKYPKCWVLCRGSSEGGGGREGGFDSSSPGGFICLDTWEGSDSAAIFWF